MSFFDSLEELQERWSGSAGGFSHVEVWDEAAAGYAEKPLPTFEDDPFLAMMQAEGALTPDARVLDIGCGAGSTASRSLLTLPKWSAAISRRR